MRKNYSVNLKKGSFFSTLKNISFSITKAKATLLLTVSASLFTPAIVLAQTGETCATAINLATLTSPYSSSTFNKANDAQPVCATGASPDLFYSIVVPSNDVLTIGQTVANYDFANSIFYGSCGNQTAIRCTNFATQSTVWQNLTGSSQTVYWLQDGLDGDAGTFTLQWSVTHPPACDIPTNVDVAITSPSAVTISWAVPNTGSPTGYQYAVTTSSTAPASGTATSQLTLANIAATPNTNNFLHVRSVCGGTNGNSEWVTYAFYGGYCVPANTTSTSYYISGITTTGGETNIANTGTGFSGYTNYSANYSVSTYAGGSFAITATHASGPSIYGVWVDWNNDYEFTQDERSIFSGALASPASLGSVIVPASTPVGQYRMRIRNANQGSPSPCVDHAWGEAEDYTVSVIEITGCLTPYALSVLPSDSNHANLTWSIPIIGALPSGYEYVFGTTPTQPQGAGTFVTDTFMNDAPYNQEQSAYLFVRSVCAEGEYSPWISYQVLGTNSPELTANDVVVYKENNTINITTGTTLMTGITIYDMSGRTLYSQTNINSTKTTINSLQIQQQIVIAEVITTKGKVSKRIVL